MVLQESFTLVETVNLSLLLGRRTQKTSSIETSCWNRRKFNELPIINTICHTIKQLSATLKSSAIHVMRSELEGKQIKKKNNRNNINKLLYKIGGNIKANDRQKINDERTQKLTIMSIGYCNCRHFSTSINSEKFYYMCQ